MFFSPLALRCPFGKRPAKVKSRETPQHVMSHDRVRAQLELALTLFCLSFCLCHLKRLLSFFFSFFAFSRFFSFQNIQTNNNNNSWQRNQKTRRDAARFWRPARKSRPSRLMGYRFFRLPACPAPDRPCFPTATSGGLPASRSSSSSLWLSPLSLLCRRRLFKLPLLIADYLIARGLPIGHSHRVALI